MKYINELSNINSLMDPTTVERTTVLNMYRHEQTLRISDFVQGLYDKYRTTGVPWSDGRLLAVEDVVQLKVLMDFGYKATDTNLAAYRSLRGIWQHDPEIAEAIVYIKYDISHAAEVAVGDTVIDVPLANLDGTQTSLGALIATANAAAKPLVLVSGSLT